MPRARRAERQQALGLVRRCQVEEAAQVIHRSATMSRVEVVIGAERKRLRWLSSPPTNVTGKRSFPESPELADPLHQNLFSDDPAMSTACGAAFGGDGRRSRRSDPEDQPRCGALERWLGRDR